jgi:hypothetical protein
MKRISILILFMCLAFWGCGSNGKSNTPPPQTQVTYFVFLETSADQPPDLTPMLGKFSVTGSDVQFSAAPAAIDTTTGKAVSGAFSSIALSADATKATFEMFGGTVIAPSNQWDIWVATLSGSQLNLVQLTNDAYADCCPQFSPDGTKVAFISYRTTERALVVRNADDTGTEQVLPVPAGIYVNGWPTYSPDGSKIAVQAEGYNAEVYWTGILVINATDGSNPQQLTNAAGCGSGFCSDSFPSYSADGSKVYFTRYGVNHAFSDIYVVNSDGTNLTMLSDSVGQNFDALLLRVNGLGDRLIFNANRSDETNPTHDGLELYSMRPDGTELTRLTSNKVFDGFADVWWGIGMDSAQAVQGWPRPVQHVPSHVTQRPDWR